jgi:hypothetical protein
VIIGTAISLSLVDNILDSGREERADIAREALFNQTQQAHENQTKTVLDTLTGGVNRQDEIVSKLDQIINNTSPLPSQ